MCITLSKCAKTNLLISLTFSIKSRPRFVPDDKIQTHLNRYHGKEQITPAGSQKSIYQKGFRTIYANSVPVAAAC